MLPFSLYCKSYRTDLRRVIRLAQSVQQFNFERIPFVVSVPRDDLILFKDHLVTYQVDVIEDEMTLACAPYADSHILRNMPGHLSQQIVKAEYWRLNISNAYLCLDSDAIFIRPFCQSDFLWQRDIPYTVMDESHEHLETCLQTGKSAVIDAYLKEASSVQTLLHRPGRHYAFGPFPLAWHRAVWESLEREYLSPNGTNLMEAIIKAPLESRWYGEALLRYQAIPLMPCQPFFKVYHYAWQFDEDRRRGIEQEHLSKIYAGVIYQSAWERNMDWPSESGHALSRFGRRLRRKLGRI